ncbi:MAG: hypothetical protein EAZ89_09890 [Bacteroidetes bacterium]|nr:MAG: hypothetical protein EAZ89_09890 [Bacteroidota bacterium]
MNIFILSNHKLLCVIQNFNPLQPVTTFAQIKRLEDLTTAKVNYYSIQLLSDQESDENEENITLFERFIQKHQGKTEIQDNYEEILDWLEIRMGELFGAKAKYFRFENESHALPPPIQFLEGEGDHTLRLYCLRLSDSVVFLFDGGVKTTRYAQECPNVKDAFYQAGKISKALTQALKDGDILWDESGGNIVYDDFDLFF